MAYASNYNNDQEQPGQPKNLTEGTGTLSSGQGGSGQPSAPAPMQEKGGSAFPDISRYLSQNQPGANRLAAQYAGGISQAGNSARNDAANLQSGFNQEIQSSYVPLNQNLVNQAASNPTGFFNFPQQPAQAPAPAPAPAPPIGAPVGHKGGGANAAPPATNSPYQNGPVQSQPINYQSTVQAPTTQPTVADQAAFNEIQNMRNANYSGPSDLSGMANYNQALTEAQNAAQIGAGSKTDEGRRDFLRGLYNKNISSPGVSNLDNLLLQGRNPTNIIRSVADQNTQLPQALADANIASQGQSQAAIDSGSATSKAVMDALNGTYGTFNTDYQNRLKAAQDATRAQVPGHNSGNGAPQLPTNVATAEDYQTLQALNALLGTNYGL